MFSNWNVSLRQMFWGDILLVGCCAFYLLWWAVAFKPVGAIKGVKSGWLLIPAFLLGVAAVVGILYGAFGMGAKRAFFSGGTILLAAVLAYVALLIATWLAFHRQVTTELLLIVGWTALTFYEVNALYGAELLARGGAIVLFALAIAVAAASMVCYVLYYDLADTAGYVDGMIPLILVAVFMAALAIFISRAGW